MKPTAPRRNKHRVLARTQKTTSLWVDGLKIPIPQGTDPNKIDQKYEEQVFEKVDGHYMFSVLRTDFPAVVLPPLPSLTPRRLPPRPQERFRKRLHTREKR